MRICVVNILVADGVDVRARAFVSCVWRVSRLSVVLSSKLGSILYPMPLRCGPYIMSSSVFSHRHIPCAFSFSFTFEFSLSVPFLIDDDSKSYIVMMVQ